MVLPTGEAIWEIESRQESCSIAPPTVESVFLPRLAGRVGNNSCKLCSPAVPGLKQGELIVF